MRLQSTHLSVTVRPAGPDGRHSLPATASLPREAHTDAGRPLPKLMQARTALLLLVERGKQVQELLLR